MTELEVTPATEWGSPTVIVELPSGNTAELRKKFPAFKLMRAGLLDADMFGALEQMLSGALEDPDKAVRMTDLVLSAMFVKPKVGDGGVPLDEIDDEDIEFVLARAFGGSPDAGFRGDEDGPGSGSDGEGVADDAVEPAGDGAGDGVESGAGHGAGGKAPRARAARGSGSGKRASGARARADRKAA
jgi:hypothetical protein